MKARIMDGLLKAGYNGSKKCSLMTSMKFEYPSNMIKRKSMGKIFKMLKKNFELI